MSAPYPTQQQQQFGYAYPPPSAPSSAAQHLGSFPPPPPQQYGTGYTPTPVETYPAPPSYENATQQSTWPKQSAAPHDVEYTGGQPFEPVLGFSDRTIRRAFIRKVYALLTLQLLVTTAFICLFLYHEGVKSYVQNNGGLYYASFGVFFVFYFILICCDSVARKWPLNIIFLAIFTLAMSYMVGTISSFYQTNIVLIMMAVTALVCLSVMIFSFQTKYDFTKWGGVLFVCAIFLFLFSIFFPVWYLVMSTKIGKIFIGGALALLFVAFLAYDTQLVMGGKKYELSPEEYIFGTLILYMDVVRIFLLLLAIFGRSD